MTRSNNVSRADNKQERIQVLKEIPKNIGYYIAGFTDGEGSFNVSLKKRKDFDSGWKIEPCFNISQKDRVILEKIKNTLRCGTLRSRRDGVVYYEVTNIKDLYEIIIPFFNEFSFLSDRKRKNFSIFSQIIELMYFKKHINVSGLQKVLELREKLNDDHGRKRKYSIRDILE